MSSNRLLPIWKNTAAVWEISTRATCKIIHILFWLPLTTVLTCKPTNCHPVIIQITELIAVIAIQTASHTSLIGFASSCHSRLILSGCFPDEYFIEITDPREGFTLDLRRRQHSANHIKLLTWWQRVRFIYRSLHTLELKALFHPSHFIWARCRNEKRNGELHPITEVTAVHWFMMSGL